METTKIVHAGHFPLLLLTGNALAAFTSYELGNAAGLIMLHTMLGWCYMLYVCLGCGGGLPYELW